MINTLDRRSCASTRAVRKKQGEPYSNSFMDVFHALLVNHHCPGHRSANYLASRVSPAAVTEVIGFLSFVFYIFHLFLPYLSPFLYIIHATSFFLSLTPIVLVVGSRIIISCYLYLVIFMLSECISCRLNLIMFWSFGCFFVVLI